MLGIEPDQLLTIAAAHEAELEALLAHNFGVGAAMLRLESDGLRAASQGWDPKSLAVLDSLRTRLRASL